MKKHIAIAAISITILSACADRNETKGVTRADQSSPAGFFHGVWHGICAPFSLIGIMFGMDVGLYESHNTGNWYNFGFIIGINAIVGGGSASRKK